MSNAKAPTEPTAEALEEIPEADFANAIRPNRYASLRGAFKTAVFIDDELWRHFGSEERVLEALRILVELAKRGAGSVP